MDPLTLFLLALISLACSAWLLHAYFDPHDRTKGDDQ